MAYGVFGVPETFFLDARGVIVEKQVGPLSPGILEKRLSQASASGGPTQ
jgi:cytochrome c biogenesis protein CcmG/thiol:disulfide interchange protein DsbE